jgi:hypothetical protein
MVSTIFFDGFGPWGTDHTGEIDPAYWDVSSGVSLSKYRDERVAQAFEPVKTAVRNFYGLDNGVDFMGHTYGAVAKLNSHWADGSQNYLKIKASGLSNPGFPGSNTWIDPTKSAASTAFGIGFFINKITTDPSGAPGATPNFSSKFLDLTNKTVPILELDAVHIGTTGYVAGGSASPTQQVGIRVRQKTNGAYHNNDTQLFTFDVWGAPWYVEQNQNDVGAQYQRMIDAYDYKYGGLYVEVCAMAESDRATTNKPYSLQIKVNGMNLGVEGLPEEKKLYIKDTWNSYAVTKASLSGVNPGVNYLVNDTFTVTDSNGGSGAILTVSATGLNGAISDWTISPSGSGFTEAPIVTIAATATGSGAVFAGNINNFSKLSTNPNGLVSKYFDSLSFYGSRAPKNPSESQPDPLTYFYYDAGLGQNINQNYMYHTYIDNVYVIGGVNDQDCFLGPTTKVFNISPSGQGVLNSNNNWQAFNLTWNSTTDIEQNLRNSNGDRSYVFTETSGAILALNMENIPSDPNYAVGGIKITNSVRKSNKDTSFKNVWGTGSAVEFMNEIGTNFPVVDNHYQYKNQYFLDNPVSTSGWTFEEINSGRFGIKKTS